MELQLNPSQQSDHPIASLCLSSNRKTTVATWYHLKLSARIQTSKLQTLPPHLSMITSRIQSSARTETTVQITFSSMGKISNNDNPFYKHHPIYQLLEKPNTIMKQQQLHLRINHKSLLRISSTNSHTKVRLIMETTNDYSQRSSTLARHTIIKNKANSLERSRVRLKMVSQVGLAHRSRSSMKVRGPRSRSLAQVQFKTSPNAFDQCCLLAARWLSIA